jgi:hypothetical protein
MRAEIGLELRLRIGGVADFDHAPVLLEFGQILLACRRGTVLGEFEREVVEGRLLDLAPGRGFIGRGLGDLERGLVVGRVARVDDALNFEGAVLVDQHLDRRRCPAPPIGDVGVPFLMSFGGLK